MTIEIKNFGPIESFTFDLEKDLHFIIGENGVGKSYASYCLYCILKNLNQWNLNIHANFIEDFDGIDLKIENAFERLRTDKEIEITDIFSEIIKQSLSISFLPNFSNSLLNTFSSIDNLKNRFVESNCSIKIRSDAFDLTINVNDAGELMIGNVSMNSSIKVTRKEKAKINFTLLVDNKIYRDFNKKNMLEEIVDFSNILLNYHRLNSDVKEVIFLPSSRSGLYQALNSFSPILAELAQNRFLLKNKKIELPALSEPLSDYFIDISTINKNHINKKLQTIIDDLERNIIRGEVNYDEASNRISYRPKNLNISLDLSESSSMVAELSTIILTLKHIVNYKASRNLFSNILSSLEAKNGGKNRKKTVLFIEEPEAHLHPEAQIKLMQIFINLIEHEITLVMTSHSDYMFNMLNNLILDKKVEPNLVGIYHLINTPRGSIVNPEALATEDGIMDDNFAQTAVKLYEERMEILDRLNSEVL